MLTIFGFGAIFAEVSSLLAITACDIVHVAWLVTVLGYMAFLTTVAATSTASLGTIFAHVTLCSLSATMLDEPMREKTYFRHICGIPYCPSWVVPRNRKPYGRIFCGSQSKSERHR